MNDGTGEQLERAADLRVREAAEAADEQERIDTDRLQEEPEVHRQDLPTLREP